MPLSLGLAKFIGGLKGDGSLIKEVGEAIDKNVVSKRELEEKALDIQLEALKTKKDLALAQIGLNTQEAKHPSLFVAGWRPSIGWGASIALFYNFVVRSLIEYCIVIWAPETPAPPALEMEHLMTIVLAMLGIGGMRSFDKYYNKDTKGTS